MKIRHVQSLIPTLHTHYTAGEREKAVGSTNSAHTYGNVIALRNTPPARP